MCQHILRLREGAFVLAGGQTAEEARQVFAKEHAQAGQWMEGVCMSAWATCHNRIIRNVCIQKDTYEVNIVNWGPPSVAGGTDPETVVIVNYYNQHFDVLLPARPYDSR